MHIAYLSLGSNIGNRRATIDRAVALLNTIAGRIIRRSSIVETDPVGFSSNNKFLNTCVCLETHLTPYALLEITQRVEKRLGRTTKSTNGVYSDRTIDIDILLYDEIRLHTHELTIPHPRMYERDFVMRPLKEILD